GRADRRIHGGGRNQAVREGTDQSDNGCRGPRPPHRRRHRSAMKNEEKTEHMPHKATLVRPSPEKPDDGDATTLRPPTEVAPPPPSADPDATIKTLRPQISETAARTLQAAPPPSQSASAPTGHSPGPAAYAPTLQAAPLTGP